MKKTYVRQAGRLIIINCVLRSISLFFSPNYCELMLCALIFIYVILIYVFYV
jgi:hypothetical protein